ncbi:pilus assembly protein [Paraburkholderia tagetis]|uniref:Pilus assembly protein n=1 Tax=Paraburkholderia tagetis TaxID=2913261 RepID=A0A9X1UF53_9BURK|nr:pilus assembly protein [Paraburkholderia tagetis]MCG5073930.1 pilus assembly protein [Paraburkholderia tagetis]
MKNVIVDTAAACRPAARRALAALACTGLAALGACGTPQGYGVGPQAQADMQMRASTHDPAPDTPGMYLGLISRMQTEGLYYASLAHIDAFERQYGATPDSILLRADALRVTGQAGASAAAYAQLLNTPLAARGHRGLGLLAGAAGDFRKAAQELGDASRLDPTNAATLSDLGYALLRDGDVAGARVPLLEALELDSHNEKIVANVALLFEASGNDADAQALMAHRGLPAQTRAAVARDAQKVREAQRAREVAQRRESQEQASLRVAQRAAVPAPRALASAQDNWRGGDAQPRLVDRFAP